MGYLREANVRKKDRQLSMAIRDLAAEGDHQIHSLNLSRSLFFFLSNSPPPFPPPPFFTLLTSTTTNQPPWCGSPKCGQPLGGLPGQRPQCLGTWPPYSKQCKEYRRYAPSRRAKQKMVRYTYAVLLDQAFLSTCSLVSGRSTMAAAAAWYTAVPRLV